MRFLTFPRFWFGTALVLANLLEAHAAPTIAIEPGGPDQFRLSWPAVETGWSLEEASGLEGGLTWTAVGGAPQVVGNDLVATITAAEDRRFFRLRQANGPLLTVDSTSPAAGETGVAITRETVFQLSAPLAPNTILDTTVVGAEAAGRKILSRVEVSEDRRRVTLYYGENLPAGARVKVSFGGPQLRDDQGRAPDLAGTGQLGSTNVLIFETANNGPLPGTAVVGRVLASKPAAGGAEVPLPNVTISLEGLEQSVRTTTAADGSFRLQPCPAGRFFVTVDGRTATGSQWPAGAYYPVIGKGWEAIAGRTNNPAGGTGIIYLPLVAAGTLKAISATSPTTVTFPASVVQEDPRLAGVEITVPANGLFADNGQRGGMVGLAPVASDRLPEPLPAGLNHAIDISIQTSGPQNFSEPVPARFPNLPDPVSGEKLPPGAKTALWSFNHDTGRWEMQGSMTISDDGNFAVSDPGVGIRQAGWHGVSNGTSGGGGPGGPPPCSPGGILAEGTSSCTPPPCDGGPENAKLKQQECFARAAACALKCYEDCGKPERPDGWFDVFSKSKDCAEAALCSKKCKDDGERCADQYFDCILHGGERRLQPAGIRREADDADPPVIAEAKSLLVELGQSADLWLALNEIANRAPSFDQLSPTDQAQAQQLAEQILAFHGGQFPAVYFGAKARNFTQMVLNSPFADGVFPANGGYYILEDLGNGLVRRGPTEARGYLNNIILRPNTPYRISLLLGPGLQLYQHTFVSGAPGRPTLIPYGQAQPLSAKDTDGDGVPDEAEFILGTRADWSDTDGDGISDLQELRNHTDPNDQQPPANGIVATLDTGGDAQDLAILGNLALVANGAAGVAVVDVTDPLRPNLLQRVNTGGTAGAVALGGAVRTVGLVAHGTDGLVLLDLAAPASPVIYHTEKPGGDFRAAAVGDRIGFAGSANGVVVAIELITGVPIASIQLPGGNKIEDLGIRDNVLYAWSAGTLHVLSLESGLPVWVRGVDSQVAGGTTSRRMRLSLGPTHGYGAYSDGIVVFDLTDPLNPAIQTVNRTTQRGWKQLVPVLPRLAMAVDGVNIVDTEPQDAGLYDLGADGTQLNFLAGYPTPGISHAVTVDRGFAFVADGTAGMQVINFLPTDIAGVAPSIQLSANFPLNPPELESGQPGRLTALADDDVFVREVQFFRDGLRIATDRSWPFELQFTAPARTAEVTSMKFFARAVDMAGNTTQTPDLTVELLPDVTPPKVLATAPGADSVVSDLSIVVARFSEPLDSGSVTPSAASLLSFGPDFPSGTPDDVIMPGTVGYQNDGFSVVFQPDAPLPPGHYRFSVVGVRDLAGNAMVGTFKADFWVAPGGPDGDPDGDGLTNAEESRAGTSPFAEDTDGDGWADEVEVQDGTNPRDPTSFPAALIVGGPAVHLRLVDPGELVVETPRPIVASPSVGLQVGSPGETTASGPWVGRPPVTLSIEPELESVSAGPYPAGPPLTLMHESEAEVAPAGPYRAFPPVTIIQLSSAPASP